MFQQFTDFLVWVDDKVWGIPLIVLILAVGIYLTCRLHILQIRHLPKALKFMVKNEEDGTGEVTSFGALCTALSATIGTGNIVGVATALVAGGPGALFWMWIAAFFGMATKYAEGVLAIKYRVIEEDGHVLGGPFYYIERGMGVKWRWLGKIFAFFGAGVGLLGIGTFTQVNGIASAVNGFFDPNNAWTVSLFGSDYSWTVVIDLRLDTITVEVVQDFVKTLERRALNTSTIRGIIGRLSSIMEKAVEAGLINKNPCGHIVIQKKWQTTTGKILTIEDQKALTHWLLAHEHNLSLAVQLGLFAGMRISEIAALQWKDIDLKNGFIQVRRNVQRVKNHEAGQRKTINQIGTPKSPKAFRSISSVENIHIEKSLLWLVAPYRFHDTCFAKVFHSRFSYNESGHQQ